MNSVPDCWNRFTLEVGYRYRKKALHTEHRLLRGLLEISTSVVDVTNFLYLLTLSYIYNLRWWI